MLPTNFAVKCIKVTKILQSIQLSTQSSDNTWELKATSGGIGLASQGARFDGELLQRTKTQQVLHALSHPKNCRAFQRLSVSSQ